MSLTIEDIVLIEVKMESMFDNGKGRSLWYKIVLVKPAP